MCMVCTLKANCMFQCMNMTVCVCVSCPLSADTKTCVLLTTGDANDSFYSIEKVLAKAGGYPADLIRRDFQRVFSKKLFTYNQTSIQEQICLCIIYHMKRASPALEGTLNI